MWKCKISGRIDQLNSLLFYNEKTLSLIGQIFSHSHVIFSPFFCDGKYSVVIMDRMTASGKRYNPKDQHFNLKSQGKKIQEEIKQSKDGNKSCISQSKVRQKAPVNLKPTPEVVLSKAKAEETEANGGKLVS